MLHKIENMKKITSMPEKEIYQTSTLEASGTAVNSFYDPRSQAKKISLTLSVVKWKSSPKAKTE